MAREMLARTIPLPGAVNLRDFGGYATRDGRRVRHGLLFRSGLLSRLEPEGRRGFLELDVRFAVIDCAGLLCGSSGG